MRLELMRFFKFCSSRSALYRVCVILPNCKIACPRENKYYFKIKNCVAILAIYAACVRASVCVLFFVVSSVYRSFVCSHSLARSLTNKQINGQTQGRIQRNRVYAQRSHKQIWIYPDLLFLVLFCSEN